jgi:probable phosphoglycerate mutase
MTPARGRILVVRHGETAWSLAGLHTGRTDVPLTPDGEARARGVARVLEGWHPELVLSSPLLRARRTAELAGLTPETDPGLLEWDYGVYEGRTTTEIRSTTGDPGWSVWDSPTGIGESLDDVAVRADGVLARCRPLLESGGEVVLVAHSHLLRILTAAWLGMSPRGGERLVLDPGCTGVLGYERETPALLRWNA